MPPEATKEKPSFLLFGLDCKSPMEAALLPPEHPDPVNVEDYREQLIISSSSVRKLAATSIEAPRHAIRRVLIHFPHEETGRLRKLSRPWHGPYRITEENDPDVTAVKVYFLEEGPPRMPTGFYWYSGNRKSPGKVPKWLHQLLAEQRSVDKEHIDEATTEGSEAEDRNVEVEKCYHLRKRETIKTPAHF